MPTANIGMTLPTVGGSSGTWGGTLNTALELVDAHDHTSGKGVLVPSSGLNINADLTFAGNAATNMKAARFTAQASISALTRGLCNKSSDNELYWVTSGGVEVKITSGSGLNISLAGGIEGDYTTSDAQVAYDQASTLYTFKSDDSPSTWAGIDTGDIGLYEKAASETNKVRLKAPASLSASYDFTFPTALPATTKLLQISSAGQVAAASELPHGTFELWLPPAAFHNHNADADANWINSEQWASTAGGGYEVQGAIPLLVGDRILSITIYGQEGNAGGEIYQGDIQRMDSAGASAQVSTTKNSGTTGADTSIGWTTADTDFAPSGYTVTTGGSLFLNVVISQDSAGGEVRLHGVKITYDRP